MELKQLRYFIAVCTWSSMSKAAEELFVTQQALSKVIANFEKEIGIQLFIRHARGVEVTEYAQAILPLAKKTVKASEALGHLVEEMTTERLSVVKFGYITGSFNNHSVVSTNVLKEMEVSMPNIRLQIKECNPDDMHQMLLDGELDIAYSVLYPEDDNIAAKVLAWEPSRLILSRNNPVAQMETITFEDLRDLEILSPSEGPLPLKTLQNAFRKAGFIPKVKQFYGTFMQTIERVRLDEGYLVSGNGFCESINQEGLAIRPFPDEDEKFIHCLLFNKERKMQAPVRNIIRYLEKHSAEVK